MLSTELARAIESEVVEVNERIEENEARVAELREYKERLVAFGKGELNGTAADPPAKPEAPPAAVKPPPSSQKRSTRTPAKRPKASEADVLGHQDKIVDAVSGGLTEGTEIREAVELDKPAFYKALKACLAAGRIAKTGERRGTRYSVPGEEAAPVNPEQAPSAPVATLPVRRSAARPAGPSKAQAEAIEERSKLVEIICAAGPDGTTAGAVAQKLGYSLQGVKVRLARVCRDGRVVRDLGTEDDAETIYRLKEHGSVPTDSDGAKTEPERKIVAALKAAPVPLTTREVSVNSGVKGEVGAMLGALSRRGVLECIAGSENGRTRWQMATTPELAEAA